ncbi:MAG: ECF transporter S component [Clostridia bacterium]|nr:ECF transporter S component [Clostridia bacterium]
MHQTQIRRLVMAALFTALTVVATTIISIPLPHGFANLGDAAVLLAGGILGGPLGIVAAGVGSALADMLLGFTVYAPATLVIKGGMAALFCWIYGKKTTLLRSIFGAVAAECVMVLGYFLYETVLYGAAVAALSIFGNAMQGAVGAAVACAVLPLAGRMKNIG